MEVIANYKEQRAKSKGEKEKRKIQYGQIGNRLFLKYDSRKGAYSNKEASLPWITVSKEEYSELIH